MFIAFQPITYKYCPTLEDFDCMFKKSEVFLFIFFFNLMRLTIEIGQQ